MDSEVVGVSWGFPCVSINLAKTTARFREKIVFRIGHPWINSCWLQAKQWMKSDTDGTQVRECAAANLMFIDLHLKDRC